MTRVLITGAASFLGRNLAAHLRARNDCEIFPVDRQEISADLQGWLNKADVLFHLGGIYRSTDPLDFDRENVGFTERICQLLIQAKRAPKVVFESSVQADLDNPYGLSKREAERILRAFGVRTGAPVQIYRLKGLFGKWCQPNHNSVTATFCYNIAHDLPVFISDPAIEIDLNYVDDVMSAFLAELEVEGRGPYEIPTTHIRLDDLAGRIQAFHELDRTLRLPDFADSFNKALYATYLSYVPPSARRYNLLSKRDERGSLAEFIKSDHSGQLFVSRTRPGVTRGNHYHHTKSEKFLVVAGNGSIRMRAIEGGAVQEYAVDGRDYQVVDIPPGFTHSITNVGEGDMVTLFWASEVFNPDVPDTYFCPVETQNLTHDPRAPQGAIAGDCEIGKEKSE
jgi:UDP-2-acetamido-2,6-beta-L-arabino-hexul-4-ose reductase